MKFIFRGFSGGMHPSPRRSSEPEEHCFRCYPISSNTAAGVHLRKWAQQPVPRDRCTGELSQRRHILIEHRIGSLEGFEIADVERIRDLPVQLIRNRIVSHVAGREVRFRQGILTGG